MTFAAEAKILLLKQERAQAKVPKHAKSGKTEERAKISKAYAKINKRNVEAKSSRTVKVKSSKTVARVTRVRKRLAKTAKENKITVNF